jgi:hypothetical protein
VNGHRALPLLLLAVSACSDGQEALTGFNEPLRVRGAEFIKGALPGSPPVEKPGMFEDGDPARVFNFNIPTSLIVAQGQGGKKVPVFVSTNSASVGYALKGLGTGWWVIPTGDLDTSINPPALTVPAVADFSQDIPVGPKTLVAVALDANGRAGAQLNQFLCVASNGPAGASECPGGAPVPVAAITLTWDTQVDLDLQVLTPDGKLVSAKHPNVDDIPKNGSFDPNKPHIDRDSNPNCIIDGARRESLIWPTNPDNPAKSEAPAGLYLVYVNLFSACNQQAVRFHVQITQAVAAPVEEGAAGASGDGSDALVERVMSDTSGEMIAVQASPGAPTGMFVTQYDFE